MSAGLFDGVMQDPKSRKYIVIWGVLGVLTILEVGVVFVPMSKWLLGAILTVMASSKAAIVGYYYMHLEHETRWLRIVALCPLIAVGYAAVLMTEAPARPTSEYLPALARPAVEAHATPAAHAAPAAEQGAPKETHK